MRFSLVGVSILVAVISVCFYLKLKSRNENKNECGKKFTYWPIVIEKWKENDNLRTMKRVLDGLGYEMVDGTKEEW
jgi:hypothetical protein